MSMIPTNWLMRKTSLAEEIAFQKQMHPPGESEGNGTKWLEQVLEQLSAQMEDGDEMWLYSNPGPNGTGGYAIVRDGVVVACRTILIS